MNGYRIFFYRGIAVPRGQQIVNPLEIRNPGPEANSHGVFFFATQFEEDWREAEEWAIARSKESLGLEPTVIRFPWGPTAGRALRGRIYGFCWDKDTRSFEWRTLSRLDRYSGREVVVDGRGLGDSDIGRLGIEIGRRNGESWIYEAFVPQLSQPEGQMIIMGERARI